MNTKQEIDDVTNRCWQLRGNFNKQVIEMMDIVRMSPPEVETLQLLYDDLQSTFNKIWPGCIVKAFGSVVTGLALKTSDVDCYLELPARCYEDPVNCVEKSKQLLDNSASPFREVSAVKSKRIPVVKFFHPGTGRYCDISFSGPIAIEFAELAGYLLTKNERALKLTLVIKCWAKVQKITGLKRLPSHALLILIIFFLQIEKILPPVATLQRSTAANIIGGWNTAFTRTTYEPRIGLSVYNLLGKFLAYYSKFDFKNLIVCPYLGYPVKRYRFWNKSHVPPGFHLYKENLTKNTCENIWLNCILCIQDPFDHARNCAGHVRSKVAGEIIHSFITAAHIYESTSKHGVLNKLFNPYTEHEPPQSSKRSRIGQRSTPRSRAWKARGRMSFQNTS